jgi:hypothetical protein
MAGEGGSRNQRGQGARGAAHAPCPLKNAPSFFWVFSNQ